MSRSLTVGDLFTGYGGLSLALDILGPTRTAWVSETDRAASTVLAHRYPDAPNLGDVTRVDWAGVEPVDVLTGGTPCQDLSEAGQRAGMRPGTRSGLWESMAHAIDHLQPALVVWENVRGALSGSAYSRLESGPGRVGDGAGRPVLRALGRVLGDLATLGYDAQWTTLPASAVGAPHLRERVFVLAHRRGASADAARLISDRGRPARRRRPEPSDSGRLLPTPITEPDQHKSEGFRASLGERITVSGAGDTLARYRDALTMWEHVLGRCAPSPTDEMERLSPEFVEWMMGLPAGWVTSPDIGISRTAQLRMLGNGVVPQQAAYAVSGLAQWAVAA